MSKARQDKVAAAENSGRTMMFQWHNKEPEGRNVYEFVKDADAKAIEKNISGVKKFLLSKGFSEENPECVNVVGITLAIRNNQIGASICVAPDHFNRKRGFAIARGRLNIKPIPLT
jgi:hypothetical protein